MHLSCEQCLPNCLMLHFAMADIQEVDGQIEKAKDIYEELVKSLEGRGNSVGESNTAMKLKDKQCNIDVVDQPALVWITYMRFLRRVENVKTSREVHRLLQPAKQSSVSNNVLPDNESHCPCKEWFDNTKILAGFCSCSFEPQNLETVLGPCMWRQPYWNGDHPRSSKMLSEFLRREWLNFWTVLHMCSSTLIFY